MLDTFLELSSLFLFLCFYWTLNCSQDSFSLGFVDRKKYRLTTDKFLRGDLGGLERGGGKAFHYTDTFATYFFQSSIKC